MAISGAATPAGAERIVNLGHRLRAVRHRNGLSLRELARQLNVSPSFVSQLENGKSQPSVATLYSLAQVLDVSIDELFESGPGAAVPVAARPPSDVAVPVPLPEQSSGAVRGAATPPPIARSALGSPADAWPDLPARPGISVTRPGSRPRLVMDSGVIWEQLAPNTDHTLDFIEIIYPVGSSSTNDGRMLRHTGHEFGILLEGDLQVTYGFEVFVLHAGEALGLDSSIPHLFKNSGVIDARGIWFVQHPA